MNLWICPACKTVNNTTFICRICGFDEHKNYSRYPSVFRLSSAQKKQYSYTLYDAETSIKKGDFFLEKEDYSSAHAWYLAAANQRHHKAQRLLGDYYSSVGNDQTQAIYWYKKAAESGDPQAQYELAECFRLSEDPDMLRQAIDLYERSANAGYAKAQYAMGNLNRGTTARLWYQKAANQGYAKAICELANDQSYYSENSYPDDETFALYLKAAKLGSGNAQREVWNHYMLEQDDPGIHSVLHRDTDEFLWFQTAFGHHEWIMKEVFFHFLFHTLVSDQKQKCLNKLKEDEVLSWKNMDPAMLMKLKNLIQNAQYEKLIPFLTTEDSILAQTLLRYYTCKGLSIEQNLFSSGTTFMIMADGLFGDCVNYAESIEKYAIWGCHDLQFDLGFCYANGFGVPIDTEKAAYWYKKAESWNPAAVWRELGILSERSKDDKTALSFYRKAADAGDSEACFCLGMLFQRHVVYKNHTEMLHFFEKAALLGHARAQAQLGICYDAGLGTTHNAEKAVYWYQKAAAQWDETGLTRLGICLEKGRGIAKSAAEAVRCYQKAADQMNGYACYLLSKCYENGIGIKNSPELAKTYLNYSIKLGNNMSAIESIAITCPFSHVLETLCTIMEHFYGYVTDENLLITIADTCFNEKIYKKASHWYQRAVSAGYNTAKTHFSLGECFFCMGKDDNKYYSDALSWYQKCDEHAAAQRQIGIIYKYGYGVPIDKKEAKKWLKSAAKLGDREAKKHLWF